MTIDGCSTEARTRCTASGCGCLNGRCSGGKCAPLNDGCTREQRIACSNFGCGCMNQLCSGGFCPSLTDGCSDETAKKCASFACGCANERCSGAACPTIADGCEEPLRKSCALSRCGCKNNQCSGGACPTIADACDDKALEECAAARCGCWAGKCAGGACPNDLVPPGQPKSGPGSADYPHLGHRLTETGKTNADALIYEPAPRVPEGAPVVVVFHGFWPNARPSLYEPLVTHLARKGYVVILPLYGSTDGVHTPDIEVYARDAGRAIAAALLRLDADRPKTGIPDQRVAFVGHGVGAMVALRLAQPDSGKKTDARPIPLPKLLVLHDPSGDEGPDAANNWNPGGLAAIAKDTKLLIISGEGSLNQGFAGTALIREPWQLLKTKTKNVWVIRSDRQCSPTHPERCIDLERSTPAADKNWVLVGTSSAAKGFPASQHALDSIDWRGYWRLTEAALRTGFGQNPIGFDPFCRKKTDSKCNDAGRRDMGEWTVGKSKLAFPTLLDAEDPPLAVALTGPPSEVRPKAP